MNRALELILFVVLLVSSTALTWLLMIENIDPEVAPPYILALMVVGVELGKLLLFHSLLDRRHKKRLQSVTD